MDGLILLIGCGSCIVVWLILRYVDKHWVMKNANEK